jgi:anti-anti-sigma factor
MAAPSLKEAMLNVNAQAIPVIGFSARPNVGLVLNVYVEGRSCVVHAAGELDRASSGKLIVTSTAGTHTAMVIDLDELTFMDSSGYDALVESRRILELEGRTLTIRGQTGEPARLLELIAHREKMGHDSQTSDR